MKNQNKMTQGSTAQSLHKPEIRELTLMNGLSFPSDQELIMLIIGSGTKDCPIEQLATNALEVLNTCNQEELLTRLCEIKGIGKNRALSLAAAFELGRRRNSYLKAVIHTPTDILPYVQQYTLHSTEHFIAATVNGCHELMSIKVISKGSTNKALIHPREVLAQAITEHASGIICCHNHPSGMARPSQADIESTKVLKQAAETLGICFMDHLIITPNSYYSFLENDILQ